MFTTPPLVSVSKAAGVFIIVLEVNTLKVNFCFLEIVRFLQPRYHPKIIGDTLKNVLKTNASVLLILKCRLK